MMRANALTNANLKFSVPAGLVRIGPDTLASAGNLGSRISGLRAALTFKFLKRLRFHRLFHDHRSSCTKTSKSRAALSTCNAFHLLLQSVSSYLLSSCRTFSASSHALLVMAALVPNTKEGESV